MQAAVPSSTTPLQVSPLEPLCESKRKVGKLCGTFRRDNHCCGRQMYVLFRWWGPHSLTRWMHSCFILVRRCYPSTTMRCTLPAGVNDVARRLAGSRRVAVAAFPSAPAQSVFVLLLRPRAAIDNNRMYCVCVQIKYIVNITLLLQVPASSKTRRCRLNVQTKVTNRHFSRHDYSPFRLKVTLNPCPQLVLILNVTIQAKHARSLVVYAIRICTCTAK